MAGPSCPIFAGLIDRMTHEQGLSHMKGAAHFHELLFESLSSAFKHKNERVAMSRWFGYIDSMSTFARQWSSRLCIYLYLCAQLGLLRQGSTMEQVKKKLALRTEMEDLGKVTTAQDRGSVRAAMNMCNTQLICFGPDVGAGIATGARWVV